MNRVNTTLLIVLALLLFAKSVFAEVLRWPQGCLSGELLVKNKSAADTRVWLQKLNPLLVQEKEFLLRAFASTSMPVSANSLSETFALLHFKNPNTIQAQFICKQKSFLAHSLEGGVLTYRRSDLVIPEFWLQNLFSDANTLQFEFLDLQKNIMETISYPMKASAKSTFKIPQALFGWKFVRLRAENRFAAFSLTQSGSEAPLLVAPSKSTLDESAAYFEVKAQDNVGDSFIARITNPEMIAKAREQISNPKLEKILFAKIKKGHGGFNRNWSKKEKSFWSWSVAEVTNLADLASTSCNGLPQVVEDRADTWSTDPGRICFWSYRIRKELKPSEVAAGY